MLSGVRAGKRKRKMAAVTVVLADTTKPATVGQPASAQPRSSHDTNAKNASAADALRRQLLARPPADCQASDDTVVHLAMSEYAPALQREDLRHGSRQGKVKRTTVDDESSNNRTIQQMIREECHGRGASMDEIYARNVARMGSRYQGTELKPGSSAGADEEDDVDRAGTAALYTTPTNLTARAARERDLSRQLAQHRTQTSVTSRCSWWLESSSFKSHTLLSVGEHVSLVLTPSHFSLGPGHCWLVPVKHAESFVACEDDVWDEVRRYRTALRALCAARGEGVLFLETVLDTKSLWQARMDVVPVPQRAEQDAPLHFKSALVEQADDWGTHTKVLSITKSKGVRHTIPKNFPYFNVEWEDGGFAQIIEERSFPRDFGLDVVSGLTGKDRVRLAQQGKRRTVEEEKTAAEIFKRDFREFDWTLDGSSS